MRVKAKVLKFYVNKEHRESNLEPLLKIKIDYASEHELSVLQDHIRKNYLPKYLESHPEFKVFPDLCFGLEIEGEIAFEKET